MSRPRRRNNNANNNGGGGNNNRNGKSSNRPPKRDFWGTTLSVAALDERVVVSPDPTAVISSLGDPPLAGHQAGPKAQLLFAVVYEKAAVFANHLARMDGVLDMGEPDDD